MPDIIRVLGHKRGTLRKRHRWVKPHHVCAQSSSVVERFGFLLLYTSCLAVVLVRTSPQRQHTAALFGSGGRAVVLHEPWGNVASGNPRRLGGARLLHACRSLLLTCACANGQVPDEVDAVEEVGLPPDSTKASVLRSAHRVQRPPLHCRATHKLLCGHD